MVKFELDEYHRNVTDDALLEDLRRVAAIANKGRVTWDGYKLLGGKYGSATIASRFGSWNKALGLAGLTVSKHHKVSDEAIFANLESVWRHLGRQPRREETCKPLSSFDGSSYERRFGSWRKALEAFIRFINKAEQDGDVPVEAISGVEPSDAVKTSTRSTRHINWRTRFLVMRRDDFKCCYCGRSPSNNPGLELHIDHVKAWSKDGPTTMDNLRTACNMCNIGKSDLDVEELT